MTYRVKVGEWLHNTTGVYEVAAFYEKGDTFCTVIELHFDNDDNVTYYDEHYWTKEETKNAIAYTTGKRYKYIVSEFE